MLGFWLTPASRRMHWEGPLVQIVVLGYTSLSLHPTELSDEQRVEERKKDGKQDKAADEAIEGKLSIGTRENRSSQDDVHTKRDHAYEHIHLDEDELWHHRHRGLPSVGASGRVFCTHLPRMSSSPEAQPNTTKHAVDNDKQSEYHCITGGDHRYPLS